MNSTSVGEHEVPAKRPCLNSLLIQSLLEMWLQTTEVQEDK